MKKTKQFLMALMLAITVFGSLPITEAIAGCPVTALSPDGSTSGNSRAPHARFRKSQSVYLITAAELAAAGLAPGQDIGQISWNYSTAPGVVATGSLIVYLQNTTDVTNLKSTTWATAITGMTIAHNASTTLPNTTGFFAIPFSGGSTFNYTGGGIYVAFDWCYSVGTLSTTAVAACNTTSNAAVTGMTVQSTTAGCPALVTTAASVFRPATLLAPAGFANDAAANLIHGLGNMAVGYNTNYAIRAVISNPGNNTLTNVPVTLNITGANSFSDVQNVASIAPCATAVVTFAGFTPSSTGTNTVSISVPSDDFNGNNSNAYTMTTSNDITSFRYVAPITGGVGFTGATGDFLGKFTAANNFGNSDTINGFEVIFTTTGQPYNVGIWTDVAGSPGTNIFTSGSQFTVADTVFISLPDVEVSGSYWIGIRQTGTTNVGFGFQTENPVRATEFKYTSPTGNTIWTDFSPAANFRISATVQYKTPQPPNCAVYLSPANSAVSCQNGVTLNYGSGGGGPTGYRVYFGTNQALVEAEDPGTLVQNSAATSYATGPLSPGGTYYWRVTAYNGIGDASGCAILSRSFSTNLASCYCTTTATNGTFEHVTNVQSGAFSNPSGSTLYSNNTGLGAINNVNINSTFNVTVTIDPLNVFDEDILYIYADFNQDGDFTDVGELCGTADVTIAGGNVYVVPVTVPVSALSGNTLLRIKFGDAVSTTAMTNDPCQVTYTYGEVEDYLLNITCGASVSATTPACENAVMNFNATYLGNSTPSTYAWSGPNGFTASIANPSIPSLSLLDAGNYTVTITDAAACVSTTTFTLTVSPAPVPSASSNAPVCEGQSLSLFGDNTDPLQTTGNNYSWSGPSFSDVTQNPNLGASTSSMSGTYTLTVTNQFGCSAITTTSVVVNPNPVLSLVTSNGVSCVGLCDGDAEVSVNAGTGTAPYTFFETVGNNYSTNGIFTDVLCEGATTVEVTDDNGCVSTVALPLNIGHISAAPPAGSCTITSMPASSCVGNVVTVSTNISAGATAYNWSGPSGTLFSSVPGGPFVAGPYTTPTNTVYIQLGSIPVNASGWEICASASNGCGPTNTNCKYIRGTLSTPAPISGSNIACPSTGPSNYSTSAVTGAASYVWTITGDASVSGTGTTASVTFGPAFTSGSLCVRAQLACGYLGAPRCLSISNSVPTLGVMSGTFNVCPGALNVSYSVPPAAGVNSYNWTLPAGATFASGAGTNAITVNFGPTYSGGSICVTGTSVCSIISAPRCKTISSNKPGTPGNFTSGALSGVCGQTITYSVAAVAGATGYTWTAPSGASLASANGTNSIDVTFTNVFISGNVCVTANNGCGSSAPRCVLVKGTPLTPGVISGPAAVCANESGDGYSITAVAGATGYVWTTPAGTTIQSGQGTTSIVLDWGTNGGVIGVTATGTCGSSGTRTLNVTMGCKVSGSVMPGTEINAYPNPVSNILNVDVNSVNSGVYTITLMDLSGRIVYATTMNTIAGINSNQLDVSGYAKGMYMLSVKNSTGFVKQIRVAVE